MRGVRIERDGRALLADLDWTVCPDDRWVVLGPNGSGKTTLLRLASGYLHPTSGRADILGEPLGRTDVRALRHRIGLTSAGLADMIRPTLTAADLVMCAKFGALEPWWHEYSDADRSRAIEQLDRVGCGHYADRTFGTLSSGERQRVLLARTLLNDPDVVLLDEPAAGLDLVGREQLLATLSELAADPAAPPLVLVTHHTEEIPPRFTHALLLREGRVVSAGPVNEVLTAEALRECFGVPLHLEQRSGRWWAWASTSR